MHARTEAVAPRRFIALPENRSARFALRRLALSVRLGRNFPGSILYLHGETGAGKTHLANWLRRACRTKSVQFVSALDWPESSDPFRHADLLIVENLQYLPERAAEKLTAVLDARTARRRPTLLTANQAPAQLRLPTRLTGRCASGLVVSIGRLSPRSRRQVIEKLASRVDLPLNQDFVDWLAIQVKLNIRQLLALIEQIRSWPRPISIDAVKNEFAFLEPQPNLDRVVEYVADHFGVAAAQLRGADRSVSIVRARHAAMYVAERCFDASLAAIGAALGGRDASTVRHGVDKIAAAMESDVELQAMTKRIATDFNCDAQGKAVNKLSMECHQE